MLDEKKLIAIAESMGIEIDYNIPPGVRDDVNDTFITYENLFSEFLSPVDVDDNEYTLNIQVLKMGYNESNYSFDSSNKGMNHYRTQDIMAKFKNSHEMPGAA